LFFYSELKDLRAFILCQFFSISNYYFIFSFAVVVYHRNGAFRSMAQQKNNDIVCPLFCTNPSLWKKESPIFNCGNELPVIYNGWDGLSPRTITHGNGIHPYNGRFNGTVNL
jgi:hypothetical protein